MCASSLRFLSAGAGPKVVLLPDALFFTRAVAITAGATAAEAAAQAELALEGIAPFPLAQLYYGWYWHPGSERAFVFAAYRRRFTSEQIEEWARAELVLPAFAAVLGAKVAPATTVLLTSPESMTAVHWDDAGLPTKVLVESLAADATDDDRAKVREELLRQVGGSKKVIEIDTPPIAEESVTDREVVFRTGEIETSFSSAVAASLDVRDKGELAALRNARKRDVLLWRVALGAAAALVLLGLAEVALVGGRGWQKNRTKLYLAQKPVVEKIESVDTLTNLVSDLATKRLLPMEMLTQLVGVDLERKPSEIIFTRIRVDQSAGLYTIYVNGKSTNPAQVNAYEDKLKNLPSVQSADARFEQGAGDRATFNLTVVFKPEAIKPAAPSVASAP